LEKKKGKKKKEKKRKKKYYRNSSKARDTKRSFQANDITNVSRYVGSKRCIWISYNETIEQGADKTYIKLNYLGKIMIILVRFTVIFG
jgi:hypothetical protein